MPIGRGSSRKRTRNDLDDYLAEVDSRLFCVTPADRQCLHRDLKAHVKELTTDPAKSDIFEGRYQISKEQLISNLGDPDAIASNYISSVGKKIPSMGLRIFMVLLLGIFTGMAVVGIDWMYLAATVNIENPGWYRATGSVMAIGGSIGLGLTILTALRFDRFYIVIIYLVIIALVLSIPLSSVISNAILLAMGAGIEPQLHRIYSTLFAVDFVMIGLIGVYLFLRHFRVMNPQVDLTV